MAKKITTFIVFTLVASAVFLAGYLISRKSLSGNQNEQALIGESLVSRFEEVPEKRVPPVGLFAISRDRAAFPTLSSNGKEILYYNPDNGEIRSVSTQNLTGGSSLVVKIQPGAQKISWASNKTLVATFPNGSIFYDLNSNTSKKLESKIKNPVLSKTGDKIAYNYFDLKTGEGNISIADPLVESYKVILPTRFGNWKIDWISGGALSLLRPSTVENPTSSLFTLDIENKSLHNILESKNNLEVIWSPDGKKIVYSYNPDVTQESQLYFMDLANQEETSLNTVLNASKCVWSIDNKTIYCAGKDSFVTIDTSSAQPLAKKIATLSPEAQNSAATASNLLLTSLEDYLIFQNTQNGKLYGLNLAAR